MAVKDFMTSKVIYVSPDTTVAHASDKMKAQDLRRLPVIENDRLVGLVTEGTMADATPSKATSLSIYEMNYLLNKTKIRDIMIRDVITVSQDASLEDAIYIMMKHKVGVLPVVDNDQLYGIITDRDIFKAFLEVSGYGEEGLRLNILLNDTIGSLEKVVRVISDANLNIHRTVVANHKSGKTLVEIQIQGQADTQALQKALEEQGITVTSIMQTEAKAGF
ncbi:CBS and ACT domain-containing protein [Streptococcus pluranimalium]|uniref:CBS and ACT domain-containing protein n=1 Tax=Streptococcus pluranimalium TaxID=82348 RepID=UPI001C4B10BD|nr:CBS and ACT domain-containing protein [Streptococcus pluranimalium]MDY3041136.1 CBS and ACT domain-containing protein [Streptococcus pluranimalium]WFM80305.1 CBS and ACT domain-containing protein [Streptococcus pluranimalium]HEM6116148.1 CBS domain-containing protein [Streptococcus suis]